MEKPVASLWQWILGLAAASDGLKNQQLFTLQGKAVPYDTASENVAPPRTLWLQDSWIWLLICQLQRLSLLRTIFGNWDSLYSDLYVKLSNSYNEDRVWLKIQIQKLNGYLESSFGPGLFTSVRLCCSPLVWSLKYQPGAICPRPVVVKETPTDKALMWLPKVCEGCAPDLLWHQKNQVILEMSAGTYLPCPVPR